MRHRAKERPKEDLGGLPHRVKEEVDRNPVREACDEAPSGAAQRQGGERECGHDEGGVAPEPSRAPVQDVVPEGLVEGVRKEGTRDDGEPRPRGRPAEPPSGDKRQEREAGVGEEEHMRDSAWAPLGLSETAAGREGERQG